MITARLALTLVTACLVLGAQPLRLPAPAQPPVRTPSLPGPVLIERPILEPAPASPRVAEAVPTVGDRLQIPSIGLDAAIEPIGVDAHGKLASPSSPTKVGWYRLGARPGATGDAVFDGHLDWSGGQGVFWNLRKLVSGDQVVVSSATRRLTFRVTSSRNYGFSETPPAALFAVSGPPRLALITCDGPWDQSRHVYLQRLVVEAALVTSS